MGFLEEVSQRIVEKTSEIIENQISITNSKGYIIGSSDKKRLNTYHPISIEVLEKREMVYYEPEKVAHLENVLPGVATPIIINNEPIGMLGIVGEPQEVGKYAQLVRSHVELMCHEYIKNEMNALESKTLDNLLRYLLNSETEEDLEYSIRYGRMLGYQLNTDTTRVCVLIEINVEFEDETVSKKVPDKGAWQLLQNNMIDILKYYFVDNKEDLLSLLTLDQFILIKAMQKDEPQDLFLKRLAHNSQRLIDYLERKYHYSVKISIGSPQEGAIGIKESYEASLKALTAGKKTSITPSIYLYDNWNILFELVGNGLNQYVSDRLKEKLSGFIHHVNFPTLANTFMTYCHCHMNMSETARILYLHRNSLVYRMEKIKELTSLDISRFDHCLLLYFAIKNSGVPFDHVVTDKETAEGN